MPKTIYILLLLLISSCHAFVGGGGLPTEGPSVIFNVRSNSNDTCHCRANKLAVDSTFGYKCNAIDLLNISYTKNSMQLFATTDSLGFTTKHTLSSDVGLKRFYFLKKGFPAAYLNIDFTPKSKRLPQAVGCDVYMQHLTNGVYYYTIIIKPLAKKGVKLIPYKGNNN